MEKNHQPDQQFLQEFGALLAARSGQGRTLPPSLTHLAEHVTSARRYQKLTRAALAQKMGVTEAEIYALEQGLLAYAELDLRFLIKLATALNEDVETFLLLLGRPALAQALQMQEVGKKQENLSRQRRPISDTTPSKQSGNPSRNMQWRNALRKGCLNLIDSLQQGRLFSIINVSFQVYPIAATLICLFLIGVSTYSLSGRFGAQSDMQSGLVMPVQPDDHSPAQIHRGADYSPSHSSRRLYWPPESITQSVTNSVIEPTATIAFMPHIAMIESQQCDVRTVGRFALCRV